MTKNRLVLILFLTTVLVYAGSIFWSIPSFIEQKRSVLESMRNNFLRELQEKFPPEVAERVRVDPPPSAWRYDPFFGCFEGNRQVVFLGIVFGLVWIVGFDFLGPHMEHEDLKLLAVIMLISGGLCLFLGGIVFGHYDPAIYGSDFPYPYRDYLFPLGYLGIVFLAVHLVLYDIYMSEKRTEPHRRRPLLYPWINR